MYYVAVKLVGRRTVLAGPSSGTRPYVTSEFNKLALLRHLPENCRLYRLSADRLTAAYDDARDIAIWPAEVYFSPETGRVLERAIDAADRWSGPGPHDALLQPMDWSAASRRDSQYVA